MTRFNSLGSDVTRQIIRPGDVGEVPPHTHAATEITGTFNFVRILKALINGDLTIRGFLRTAKTGQRIEVRPAGTEGGLVPSIAFHTGQLFTSEPFIEVEDQGAGVWALKLAGPWDGVSGAAFIRLQSNDLLIMQADTAISLFIGAGNQVGTLTATGLTLTVPVLLPDGTVANPAIAFASDPTGAGLFKTADGIGIAV